MRGSRFETPEEAPAEPGADSGETPTLIARAFSSPRYTTHYWEAGPADGPLMIFVHGWPEIGHWLPLERKAETIQAIRSWLKTKRL